MIYVTGDCHARYDKLVGLDRMVGGMTKDDVVIVCGDFGIWHDGPWEHKELAKIEQLACTVVFVDGNHENFDRLYGDEFPVVDFCGGKAHKIRENLYHLMRGYVFEFGGKTFWAFGGARSHDIDDGILDQADYSSKQAFLRTVKRWDQQGRMYRINHVSWWSQEMPSKEEMDFGRRMLAEHGDKVDYIITHCAPQNIAALCGFLDGDELTRFFNVIDGEVEFKRWFFGHYHADKNIGRNHTMLYNDALIVE